MRPTGPEEPPLGAVESPATRDDVGPADILAPSERTDAAAAKVRRLETIVAYVLRYGVLISFAIMLVGSALLFAEGGQNTGVRLNGAAIPQDPGAVLVSASHLDPRGIIDVGLMFLIATPVLRVAVSVIGFLMEEDFVYTAATLFVLTMLLASFFLGKIAG